MVYYQRFNILIYCLIILAMLLGPTKQLYSEKYRKCILDDDYQQDIGHMQIEKIFKYKQQIKSKPQILNRKALEYLSNNEILYHKYVGGGGSGEVYLVQHEDQNGILQPKFAKRFFEERISRFQEENYIMNKLKYKVEWIREAYPIQSYSQEEIYQSPTIALYRYQQALPLDKIDIREFNIPMLIYKICKEVYKLHKHGIIHNDLKPGNIVVINSQFNDSSLYKVELVDWNLASFYYTGYESNKRKGTACFFAPQSVVKAKFLTPAIDVYSLGVVLYQTLTGRRPFLFKCQKKKFNNLQAIVSRTGYTALDNFLEKYKINYDKQLRNSLGVINQNLNDFEGVPLQQLIPEPAKPFFNNQLIDLLEKMLQFDPQQRLTMKEVLKHEYFKQFFQFPPMKVERDKQRKRLEEEMKIKMQEKKRLYELQKQKQKQALKIEQEKKSNNIHEEVNTEKNGKLSTGQQINQVQIEKKEILQKSSIIVQS